MAISLHESIICMSMSLCVCLSGDNEAKRLVCCSVTLGLEVTAIWYRNLCSSYKVSYGFTVIVFVLQSYVARHWEGCTMSNNA